MRYIDDYTKVNLNIRWSTLLARYKCVDNISIDRKLKLIRIKKYIDSLNKTLQKLKCYKSMIQV